MHASVVCSPPPSLPQFPIGIDAERFISALETNVVKTHVAELRARFHGRKVRSGQVPRRKVRSGQVPREEGEVRALRCDSTQSA